jgi:hypothetical protein
VLALSILRHNDHWPFYMVALIFVSAFGTLALSFVLALHDPLCRHHRRGRRAAFQSCVHVLGVRVDRLPTDAALHDHQLQCFQGQGPSDRRALLVAASNPRITNGDRAFHPLLH